MLYRSEILKGCDSVSIINQSFWESLNIALCTLWDYFGIGMLSVFHFCTHIITGKLLFDPSGSLSVISDFLPVLLQCICSINDREGQIELSGLVLCASQGQKTRSHSFSRFNTAVQGVWKPAYSIINQDWNKLITEWKLSESTLISETVLFYT